MKKTVFAFLLMALVASCNKEGSNTLNGRTVVTGRLLDASTLEPIAGGTVTIEYGDRSMDTVTGPNGEYRFDFEHDDKHTHYLIAEAEWYFGNDNVGAWGDYYPTRGRPSSVQLVNVNRANSIDIKLPPKGFISYQLTQVNPYSGSIKLNLSPRNPFSTQIKSFNGNNLNTTFLDTVPGGAFIGVRYSIIRNGDSLQAFFDTIFVPRFDTLHYTIEF